MHDEILSELVRAVGRIEGKLDGMAVEQERTTRYAQATSARVGALERASAGMKGWAAGAGAAAGAILGAVWALVAHIWR